MKEKDVRFKIEIHNKETQLSKKFLYATFGYYMVVLKKDTVFKENSFSQKLFFFFAFKIDCMYYPIDPNTDPN